MRQFTPHASAVRLPLPIGTKKGCPASLQTDDKLRYGLDGKARKSLAALLSISFICTGGSPLQISLQPAYDATPSALDEKRLTDGENNGKPPPARNFRGCRFYQQPLTLSNPPASTYGRSYPPGTPRGLNTTCHS